MKTTRRRAVRRSTRNSRGLSLTELLLGSLLLGVSLAVVAELMALCVMANVKLTRQFDAQAAARIAVDRIKRDVRMAQSIQTEITIDKDNYPSEIKRLTAQKLILHMPIHYLDKRNDPVDSQYSPGSALNPLNGITLKGYYEVVYDLVADSQRPGEFVLQMTCEKNELGPVDETCSYRKEVLRTNPQRIVSGIIGPLEVNAATGSPPRIFSYISKRPNTSIYPGRLDMLKDVALVNTSAVRGISLVGVDLEVKRTDVDAQTAESSTVLDKTLGVHAEVGLRLPPASFGTPMDDLYETTN
ncbi:MAG: hypothetical protein K2X93_17865 [Candidatus Obscuribacterales bacterium]|nr:hypothetical protein [Candidatus Obscuribacterales bacterium]